MRKYTSTVEYVKGSEGMTGFCQNTPLKCICLVFHGENGQNESIRIIFSFTNILACIDL